MAIRTASTRAHLIGEGEFRKKVHTPFIIMSKHGTACKLCKPYEGKILIDDVYSGGSSKDGKYTLLSEAMKQGLYHPNCRHGHGTYYPELGKDTSLEIVDKVEEEPATIEEVKTTGNAKTVTEALKNMTKYSDNVSLNGIRNLKNLNEVNSTLDSLTTKYPIRKLKDIKLTRSRKAMASANFETLNLKKSYFDKESFDAVENVRKQNEEQYKLIVDKLERLKTNQELDEYVLREYKRQLEQAKRMLENSFKYKRFNVVYDDAPIQSVITHEYGHIIADQYIGQINKGRANLNFDYNINNELYQLNNKIDSAYRKAIQTGDIYEISEYASSKSSEFFAEVFTIYDIGKEKLPDYIVEVIEEVIDYGKKSM